MMDDDRSGMPIFVKLDEYKDILDILNLLRNKMEEAKSVLGKINELKNEEDSELELWKNKLEEVERKIGYIDKTLFEPKNH